MVRTDLITADLPVALHSDFGVNAAATLKLVEHVRRGGIAPILFGGNANLQSLSLSQFEAVLDIAVEAARFGPVTIGMGPELGRMLDQLALVQRSGLSNVLVLPILGPADTHGTADGMRHIADRLGHGVIVDLVRDNHLRPVTLAKLLDEGVVEAVRYSVVTANPGDDGYLDRILAVAGSHRLICGVGETAAIDHLYTRRLIGMTSGAASLAPAIVVAAVAAIEAGRLDNARQLLAPVIELERVRAMLGPVSVLHDAVTYAGIAAMGPQMPMLSKVKDKYRAEMEAAVAALLAHPSA